MVYGILAVWHGKTDGFLHMIINFAHFTQKEAVRVRDRDRDICLICEWIFAKLKVEHTIKLCINRIMQVIVMP